MPVTQDLVAQGSQVDDRLDEIHVDLRFIINMSHRLLLSSTKVCSYIPTMRSFASTWA